MKSCTMASYSATQYCPEAAFCEIAVMHSCRLPLWNRSQNFASANRHYSVRQTSKRRGFDDAHTSRSFPPYVYKYAVSSSQRRTARQNLQWRTTSGRNLECSSQATPHVRETGPELRSAIDLRRHQLP